MPAIIRDIVIEQGGVLSDEIILKSNGVVVDLTGYTSIMTILDFKGVVTHIASTENGQLVVDGPAGTVKRFISAEVTKTIPTTSVSYDWELTPSLGADHTFKVYRGKCKVIAEGSSGR